MYITTVGHVNNLGIPNYNMTAKVYMIRGAFLSPLSFHTSLSLTLSLSHQMSATDRGLVNAFKDIGTMADKLNLPRIIVVRVCVCDLS